jgi:hypothetical protein
MGGFPREGAVPSEPAEEVGAHAANKPDARASPCVREPDTDERLAQVLARCRKIAEDLAREERDP